MDERRTEKDRDVRKTTTTTETVRESTDAGERTTRAGAALGAEPTTPVTVVTPTTPRTAGTIDTAERRHARDPTVHPDWETQPQVNAPRDVGIPTAEGQADAARLRAGQRRSDVAEEPRIDRRGGEYEVPAASGARVAGDDRTVTEKMKDKARDVKDDVDRRI